MKTDKRVNPLKLSLLLILTLFLGSCHHAGKPLYSHQRFTQLNTVIAPWEKENDLLPWKGQNHLMIINSVDDVYATQTERFIEENPNWLQVDFSTKSIIAVRTILFDFPNWEYTSITGFGQLNEDDDVYGMKQGDYRMWMQEHFSNISVEEDEETYRIYQIAIVTDKVPGDAVISLIMSVGSDRNFVR